MRYIDFHCDTLTELKENETLKKNGRCVCIDELKKAEVLVQCCSMFVPTGLIGVDNGGNPPEHLEKTRRIKAECDRIYSVYCREMNDNRDCLRPVLKYDDIKECISDGKTGILLTIEDGGVLEYSGNAPEKENCTEEKKSGEIHENLEDMYKKGVRLITLTWNHENCLAYPNSENRGIMEKGLKQTGADIVRHMNELGIVVDVSHLSDGGFYQVAEIMSKAGKPFVASHSNARTVAGHRRNMTDDMIRVLADNGGVMGLNLAPSFLDDTQKYNGSSRIADMVRHILHIRNVGGAEVLAIGSDFDGIGGQLEVKVPSDFEKLWSALQKAGMVSSELEKMWQGNGLRVLSELI